ncbi:head GIN domain-containing protein [uncultured Proteiniphilum sp.]|uniref:head GIN domain-containing protein n=1 Tax=uncultured Proteiniphilum sp. TaxID=497637 RepID=UPI0026303734|nr:head GIN domain-containing protein [uncultured Proteiniphilum sp.]
MKALFTIILAAMAIVSAPAQNGIVKQNRQVAPFTAISASGGWDVVIRQGNRQSVSIEISEEALDRAIVEVKNGTLHIYNKHGNRSFSLRNLRNMPNITQKAYVTVTDLQKMEASGGVDVRFETPIKTGDFEVELSGGTDLEDLTLDCNRFNGQFSGGCDADIRFTSVQHVKAEVSGGSDVELRDISAQTCRIDASGGCDIELMGKTVDLTLNASGGCDISASNLVARNGNANFSGAADGNIRVTDRLDITVSGSADVTCFGDPREVSKKVHKSSSLKFR